MTYTELAERLGISGDAARQLVRRRKWRRIMSNHPNTPAVIVVPPDVLEGEQRHEGPTRELDPPDVAPTARSELSRIVGALEAMAAEWRERRAAWSEERARLIEEADRERSRAEGLREEVDRAAQVLTAERGRADVLRERADEAAARVQEAKQRIAELETAMNAAKVREQLRQLAPLWRRFLAAWRRE